MEESYRRIKDFRIIFRGIMMTYEDVCKKLGFRFDDYQPEYSNFEDDSRISPLAILTAEELDILIDHEKKRLKKLGVI